MAPQKSRRQSRKARAGARVAPPAAVASDGGAQPGSPVTAPRGAATARPGKVTPRVASAPAGSGTRREQRAARERRGAYERAAAQRTLGTFGERPRSVFDPIPVSEIAILAGLIAVVIGLIRGGGPALIGGAIVCAVGVLEFTAREHFSGYRSHATLLAAFPAVLVEVILALCVGVPNRRVLLLVPVVPVFALSFWLAHRSFATARHTRATRPPSA